MQQCAVCPASAYLLTVGHNTHWALTGTLDRADWSASVLKGRKGVPRHNFQQVLNCKIQPEAWSCLSAATARSCFSQARWGARGGCYPSSSGPIRQSAALSSAWAICPLHSGLLQRSGSAFTSWKTQRSNWAKLPKSKLTELFETQACLSWLFLQPL